MRAIFSLLQIFLKALANRSAQDEPVPSDGTSSCDSPVTENQKGASKSTYSTIIGVLLFGAFIWPLY